MSLSEYKRKRQFERTPEPEHQVGARHAVPLLDKNRFVLHYHDASHLHYDLRLEIGGALKSWAVPKGLPTRPDVKKLAVQVEDHPVEYLTFQGEIPKGEYGAGTVKIFDSGTFQAAHPGEIQTQLENGKCSFFLEGRKIQGKFTLVRTRRGKDWLLLMGAVEQLNPWIHSVGVVREMPQRVEPMKALLADNAFSSNDWLYEVKWDGVRAVAYLNNGRLSLLSRNLKEQNFRYPELSDLADFVLGEKIVLDGEIVAFDERGLPSFEKLQSRMNLQQESEIKRKSGELPVVYFVFDVLFWQGRDLQTTPLWRRKQVLNSILIPHRYVVPSDFIETEGIAFFEAAKQQGLEGVIAKKKDSYYEQKRSGSWLKIKAVRQQEVVIAGFTEPRETRPYFGALLLGVYEDGRLVYVGHAGTGFGHQTLKDVYDRMTGLEISESPFERAPLTNERAHWTEPKLVAEVKFSEWTKAGKMRQPVFLGLRNDINPREVIREENETM